MKQYFAGLSRNSFLLAAASFFADTSTEMLYPVLPVFLTRTLKASGSIVGSVSCLGHNYTFVESGMAFRQGVATEHPLMGL
jgi:hypothetical protein